MDWSDIQVSMNGSVLCDIVPLTYTDTKLRLSDKRLGFLLRFYKRTHRNRRPSPVMIVNFK